MHDPCVLDGHHVSWLHLQPDVILLRVHQVVKRPHRSVELLHLGMAIMHLVHWVHLAHLTRMHIGHLTRVHLGHLTRVHLGHLTRAHLGHLTRVHLGHLTRVHLGHLFNGSIQVGIAGKVRPVQSDQLTAAIMPEKLAFSLPGLVKNLNLKPVEISSKSVFDRKQLFLQS